jgi:hypothetical protein
VALPMPTATTFALIFHNNFNALAYHKNPDFKALRPDFSSHTQPLKFIPGAAFKRNQKTSRLARC